MGPKCAGSFFQRNIASKVLAGLIYCIGEFYIGKMLLHGKMLLGVFHLSPESA